MANCQPTDAGGRPRAGAGPRELACVRGQRYAWRALPQPLPLALFREPPLLSLALRPGSAFQGECGRGWTRRWHLSFRCVPTPPRTGLRVAQAALPSGRDDILQRTQGLCPHALLRMPFAARDTAPRPTPTCSGTGSCSPVTVRVAQGLAHTHEQRLLDEQVHTAPGTHACTRNLLLTAQGLLPGVCPRPNQTFWYVPLCLLPSGALGLAAAIVWTARQHRTPSPGMRPAARVLPGA